MINMVIRQFCVDLRFIIDLFPLAFFARPLVLDVVYFRSKYLNIVFFVSLFLRRVKLQIDQLLFSGWYEKRFVHQQCGLCIFGAQSGPLKSQTFDEFFIGFSLIFSWSVSIN